MYRRELPEATWQRTNFRDASTCADPGFAAIRASLSMTSLKCFGNRRHHPYVYMIDSALHRVDTAKDKLIESMNPGWKDLAADWYTKGLLKDGVPVNFQQVKTKGPSGLLAR